MPRSVEAIDKHIGARVRMRRLEQRMSQATLAEALDLSFQQVQKYEKGTNRVPSGVLPKIATALNCSVSFFYENAPGGVVDGGDTEIMTSFMTSADGIALALAFNSLPEDGKLRRTVRDVVVGIAASQAMLNSKLIRSRVS